MEYRRIEKTARDFIDKLILVSDPLTPEWNRENRIFRKQPKWNYMDSCIIRALLMHSDKSPELTDYAVKFMNSYVDADGNIPTLKYSDFNLDNVCGGRNLLALYRRTSDRRYFSAAENIVEKQIKNQPRLSCGNFWHKAIYPHQVWLDGIYMALPFLVEYGQITGDRQHISDALSQLGNIRRLMRDNRTGLYYHGYCETKEQLWADKNTGLSGEFWLRSNGWLCAGLADIYELTGDSECGDMLSELLEALADNLTEDGMLMQLLCRPELEGNYPETSGSLLFAYSALKAGRMGVITGDFASVGERVLMEVTDKYIIYQSGVPVLKNICLMGGLGGETRRDGSAEYYLSEPVVENDAKGIAPYLMAAAEMKRPR